MSRAGPGRLAAAATALGFAALVPVAATPEDGLRSLAAAAGQGEPILRIGLDSGHRIQLFSSRPFRILDPSTGKPVWKESYSRDVTVVAEGGPEGEVPRILRVQVAAYSDPEVAESERRRLTERFKTPGVVHHDPDRGTWRVRLGEAERREALAPLVSRLRTEGHEGLWIVEEPARERGDIRLRLVDSSYQSSLADGDRLAVVPGPGGRVSVEGKPWRGVMELRVSPYGTIRPINWIGLESYLLGVVPAELGPEVWPELEALKAQAVAARTYAWRNRGQFEEEGFDLCATPRCQAYGGASAEHPLSDRAVAATRGEILTRDGEPIAALYTATCGGHTEDAANVFPEEAASYLVGVPCRAETQVLASHRVPVRGRELAPVVSETGEDATRDWALLRAAGILEDGAGEGESGNEATPARLRRWTARLARAAGRPEPRDAPGSAGSLGEAAASPVVDLGWSERTQVLIGEEDLPALLRDPDAAGLPLDQRRALAYLAYVGALGPFPDGRFHVDRPPSRERLIPPLARIGEAYDAFGLREGVVAGGGKGRIRLVQKEGTVRLPLAEPLYLFGRAGDRVVATPSLDLWPGDRVRFRKDRRGRVDFLELRTPVKGVSDDRSASVYSWEVRMTRPELESAINRQVAVGRLEDLQVVRRGVSGRVVELRVIGDRASTTVKGFDVRRLLGLRESLVVLEPQRDASGRLEAVVFAGKGWGHGVGLCQVGAYGMAVRGHSYREILAHYYRGTALERVPSGSR